MKEDFLEQMDNKKKTVQCLVTLEHTDNSDDWCNYVRLALVGMMIPVVKVEVVK